MQVSIVEQNAAFEAAIRELSRKYPPRRVPMEYPVSTTSSQYYTIYEETLHDTMIHKASLGWKDDVLNLSYRSGIPREEILAVIALIYG